MPIGPIMLDIAATKLSDEDKDILQNPLVGGLILFSRNYENPQQLQQLIYDIRNCRKDPILIAVDQEGGRVQRFQKEFTQLPACGRYGELYDQNPDLAVRTAETAGWLMAMELLAVGVDISFAPVLDLDRDNSEVIRTRGFHHNPDIVSELAAAFIFGMGDAGMACTGKHFPGHGFVSEDSHSHVPTDDRDFQAISKEDLVPFQNLSPILDAIMPAHIIFPNIDKAPVGFSEKWLQEILRQQMAFNGVIFSDDLSMAGAEVMGAYTSRAEQALRAGCDMILVCNNRQAAVELIDSIGNYQNPRSQQRLLKLCGRFNSTREELQLSNAWHEAREELNTLFNI